MGKKYKDIWTFPGGEAAPNDYFLDKQGNWAKYRTTKKKQRAFERSLSNGSFFR